MSSRQFPAPPDLSELLKFFESKEGKARVEKQHSALGVRPQRVRQAPKSVSSTSTSTTNTKAWIGATKPTSDRGLSKPTSTIATQPRITQKETTPSIQWNASTQLPAATSKTLRHQLLSRTYQPPAPVYVVPSEASHLLDRLAKGTISSRSKLHSQNDQIRLERGSAEEKKSRVDNSADTRGRDAIQTLLFYRKEVEKRRRLDPSNLRPGE